MAAVERNIKVMTEESRKLKDDGGFPSCPFSGFCSFIGYKFANFFAQHTRNSAGCSFFHFLVEAGLKIVQPAFNSIYSETDASGCFF